MSNWTMTVKTRNCKHLSADFWKIWRCRHLTGRPKNRICYSLHIFKRSLLHFEFSDVEWIGCIDHLLHLATIDVTSSAATVGLLNKVRTLMRKLHKSSVLRQALKENGSHLQPIMDVPTRWGSTLAMLKRYLELGAPLRATLLQFPDVHDGMTPGEDNSISSLVHSLAVVHDMSKQLGAENCCTSSLVIPMLTAVIEVLEESGTPFDIRLKEQFLLVSYSTLKTT